MNSTEVSHDFQIVPFSRAYDIGNYGHAYEDKWTGKHDDYRNWRDSIDASSYGFTRGCDSAAFEAGLAWGYFSSFELYEIPASIRDWISVMLTHPTNIAIAEAAGIAARDD